MALTMCSHLDNYQMVIWRQNWQLYYQIMGHQTKANAKRYSRATLLNDVISLVILLNGQLVFGFYGHRVKLWDVRHLRV